MKRGGKMKKLIALTAVFSFLAFNIGFVSPSYAQTETIAAEEVAKDLAQSAGGTYVEGSAAPVLTGNQVALPIIDETTGNVLGHIVAEQENLVSALNAAGLTDVANALAAAEAGTAAGVATGTGFALGTTGTIAVIAAGVAGVALAVSSGGGSTTTAHH
ncbi:hypothetical protein BMS3Abin06_02864 [bacterium BMS3Abin06]|nr:hypothetical protein BMS3Abin06_02864 [bacterium BMS3Abin06]